MGNLILTDGSRQDFEGPVELAELLAGDSEDRSGARSCFTQQMLEVALSHALSNEGDCSVAWADAVVASSGGSTRGLVQGIVTSDMFWKRIAGETE